MKNNKTVYKFQNIITWLKYTILIKYIRINHARLETKSIS